MAVTQNTYTGDGTTVLFSFTFPYLETTDIKVSLNGTNTTAYTLANATTIQFNTAPANGAAIRIYRQTDDSALAATFYPGSAIRSSDLNENFTQNLYVTQESSNNATTATTTANTALTNSNTAISTANSAVSTANTASSNASAAVATANTASSNASAAVSTANTASSNATTAVNTANAATATANSAASDAATALSTANAATSTANAASTAATNAVNTANAASSAASSAVSTANTASTNASNAVTTANTASSNATTAVNTANSAVATANSAAAAVANAVIYTIVANVAAIPASPSNNTAIEVANSTGIESFTPLAGKPGGFVGNSGLSVRILYSTAGSTWNWVQYFPNDPEARYLKLSGGTLTGALLADDSTSVASPVIAFDGDTNTGIAHTGADELALVTGGSARLTIDGSGNVAVPGTLGVTGAITGSSTVTGTALIPSSSTVPTNGVYLPAANSVAISTGGSGRLFIDSSGRLGIGTSAPDQLLHLSSSTGPVLRFESTDTTLNNGDLLGTIEFESRDISTNAAGIAADIYAEAIATAGNASLVFRAGSPVNLVERYRIAYNGEHIWGGSTERVRIDSSGRLGVGTSSPSELLTINSNGATGTAVRLENTSAGGYNWGIYSVGSAASLGPVGSLAFRDSTNGATRLVIDSSGRLGVGTTTFNSPAAGRQILEINGTSSTLVNLDTGGTRRAYLFTDATDTYLYNTQAGSLVFGSNDAERARIDSSGRLGIGTSVPRFALSLGATTPSSTATPTTIDLGGTYSSTTGANAKLKVYWDGSNEFGFGVSAGQMDYIAAASNGHGFFVGSTQVAKIDSSGRLGIGTTNPGSVLHSKAATNQFLAEDSSGNLFYIQNNGGETALNAYLSTTARAPIVFKQYTSECGRWDASGRLLVGTSSSNTYAYGTTPSLQVESNSYVKSSLSVFNNENTDSGSVLSLGKSRGTSVGSNTVVQNNDYLGEISWVGADGSNRTSIAASINCRVDGTPGANDMPGRLVFSTTSDGASSPTERMRIRNNGEILFGCSGLSGDGPDTAGGIYQQRNGNTKVRVATDGSAAFQFYSNTSPTTSVGSISVNASSVAFNTSSDYRLKENITLVTDGITRLQQLKPSRFNFIADSDHTVDGFIAHEVQSVVPEAITGTKDEVDADGNPVYQGIDQSKLVPLLTAALQEAIGEIESLKARVAALESA